MTCRMPHCWTHLCLPGNVRLIGSHVTAMWEVAVVDDRLLAALAPSRGRAGERYGLCHWWRGRSFYTDPAPAGQLPLVRNRRVHVYDDDQWRPGTLHGWRRRRDREWETAVQLTGWPSPAWVPASRVRPE
jgi:hypothetical protein